VPRATSKISARAKASEPVVAASAAYDDWLVERLKDPEEAAAYLEAVLEDADQGALMLALRQIAIAQGGVAMVARKAKLTREATYRMLSDEGNPALNSFLAILAATGLRMSIRPQRLPK
jgi:probable addiction module antidote protein